MKMSDVFKGYQDLDPQLSSIHNSLDSSVGNTPQNQPKSAVIRHPTKLSMNKIKKDSKSPNAKKARFPLRQSQNSDSDSLDSDYVESPKNPFEVVRMPSKTVKLKRNTLKLKPGLQRHSNVNEIESPLITVN
jgi:hypothetical protein